jgi:hypothetical protein
MTVFGDRAAVACAVVVALAAPSVASAAPGSTDTDATARALYREAVALERQNRLDDALARLEAAYRTVKSPVLGLELAKVNIQLGHLVAAYDAARGVDDIPLAPRETERGRDARREAATLTTQIRERLALLRVTAPADLGDSVVKVDGAPLDDGGSTIVDPGTHTLTLALGGHECAAVVVTVQEGETRAVDLRDRAGACAPSAPPPRVVPPPRDADAPPSSLARAPSAPPSDTFSTTQWTAIGLVGAGALTATIGGIVAIRAKGDYDAVSAQCAGSACLPSAYEIRESARGRATGATYAIGLGLLSAAAGVTLWVVDANRPHPSQRVGVAVSASGISLVVAQ